MKEQKELIEAALALVDALEEKGWFECREEARLTRAAEAYRKAQEQLKQIDKAVAAKDGRYESLYREACDRPHTYRKAGAEVDPCHVMLADAVDMFYERAERFAAIYENSCSKEAPYVCWKAQSQEAKSAADYFASIIKYCFLSEAQEQPKRRKAPWKDSEGNDLFEGDDVLVERNGRGKIIYTGGLCLQWRIRFEEGGLHYFNDLFREYQIVKVTK